MALIDKLNFDGEGLIPAVIQDHRTMEVLTLCYMDREALEKTMKEKKVHVFRRSKGRVMIKGETSGCVQTVREVYVDCADNSVLFKVDQERAACHKGYFSCYFRRVDAQGDIRIDAERLFDPAQVYLEKGSSQDKK